MVPGTSAVAEKIGRAGPEGAGPEDAGPGEAGAGAGQAGPEGATA